MGVIFGPESTMQIRGISHTIAQLAVHMCFVIPLSKFNIFTNFLSNDIERKNFLLNLVNIY